MTSSSQGGDTQDSRGHGQSSSGMKQQAQAAAAGLKDSGLHKLEQGKSAAADQAKTLAGAFDAAADRLGDSETLGAYARAASQRIASLAEHARNRSLDELFVEAQALARRNPGLFALGSVGAGIMLARFLKASAHRRGGSGEAVSGGPAARRLPAQAPASTWTPGESPS